MTDLFVNIHTHRPAGRGIELRAEGVHPWDADREDPASRLDGIEAAQAVGEIGLDRVRGPRWEEQLCIFRAQLRLAREMGKPVVLHCVRAFEEVMRELGECEPRAVIFHGFIGSPEQARQALARGYYLSYGERTFASRKTMEALRATPLSHLFLETDESTTPIERIYARAAEVRGVGIGELQRATRENYERLFGKHDG